MPDEHCPGAPQIEITSIHRARREYMCLDCGSLQLEPVRVLSWPAPSMRVTPEGPDIPTPEQLLHAVGGWHW